MLEEWTVVVGALISYWAPRGELCSFRTAWLRPRLKQFFLMSLNKKM